MLKANDRVVVIAPAAQFRRADRELLDQAVSLLESWLLQVDVLVEQDHFFYLAGNDELRQKHLNEALTNVDYKAVFCTRGGYGSARLLANLPSKQEVTSKYLVGHSDITTLHLAAADAYSSISSIHGPNIATRQILDDSSIARKNQQSLYDSLFTNQVISHKVKYIKDGKAEGSIIGGCLSMIVSLLGTPYFPDLTDRILLIEDVAEAPYKIDRMLQQLCNAGVIGLLKGIVFGDMYRCQDPYNDLVDVIQDVLSVYSLPVAYGLQTGHGEVNYSIPLGKKVILNSDSQTIVIQK